MWEGSGSDRGRVSESVRVVRMLVSSVSGNIFWDFLTILFFFEAPRSGRRRHVPQANFLGDVT